MEKAFLVPKRISSCAFTLVELLATLAVIAVLASLILPAAAKARSAVRSVACLSNLKQLQLCWQAYVDDHNGFVPPNLSENVQGVWRSTSDSWIGRSNAQYDRDTDFIQSGLLFRYDYNRSLKTYVCPADRSMVRTSPPQGPSVRRTRSYSMNGNWGGRTGEVQKTVRRLSAATNPGRVFVFIDEDEDSIDDAHFLVWPAPDDRWVNLPADRHGRMGVLTFADGHGERWRWKWAKSFQDRRDYWKRSQNAADLADLQKLQKATLELVNFKPQP